jgi:hypothetical protein
VADGGTHRAVARRNFRNIHKPNPIRDEEGVSRVNPGPSALI